MLRTYKPSNCTVRGSVSFLVDFRRSVRADELISIVNQLITTGPGFGRKPKCDRFRECAESDDLAWTGRLVMPFDLTLPMELAFYFVCPVAAAERRKLVAFRERLVREAGHFLPETSQAEPALRRRAFLGAGWARSRACPTLARVYWRLVVRSRRSERSTMTHYRMTGAPHDQRTRRRPRRAREDPLT